MKIRHIIKVARPTHWIKNLFVFLPVFFGGGLLNTSEAVSAALTFLSFSLAASAIYCLNDIIDVNADRAHPVKCKRPIASGAITIPQAYGMMALSMLVSIVLMFLLPAGQTKTIFVIVAYFLINVAYCLRLKDYAIIDVCIIASGFVLRILAGGYATGVQLSKWIVLMTFLLTLFLAFAKRRDDVLRMNTTGQAPRANKPLQPHIHQSSHHHHRRCHACLLCHVHRVARDNRPVCHRQALSHLHPRHPCHTALLADFICR